MKYIYTHICIYLFIYLFINTTAVADIKIKNNINNLLTKKIIIIVYQNDIYDKKCMI